MQLALIATLKFHLYPPRCLAQETAKRPFGLRVKLSCAHLSSTCHTRWRLHTVTLFVEDEPESTVSVAYLRSIHSNTD